MKKMESGFTLIELVMVIVILGILAASALPKFVDLSSEASVAAADGVFGAVNAATAINHSAKLVGRTVTLIDSGTNLLAAMDGTPSGWHEDDTAANCNAHAGITGTVGGCICLEASSTPNTTCNADETYIIALTAAETSGTGAVKAVLAKSW